MASARPLDGVLQRVAALSCDLPSVIVDDLAGLLERTPLLDVEGRAAILEAVSQRGVRRRVGGLLEEWSSLGLGGAALAWSLRAAHATDAAHRRRQRLELVWTGPAPRGTTLRRTDQALLELVRGAHRRLVIVSFAVYKAPNVHEELLVAARRGVAIDFVFETPDESEGKIDTDPRRSLGPELLEHGRVWVWPLEQRERDERGRHGTLHAKCALADATRLLISSANLTGDALSVNMELGVLIEGGAMPRDVEEHIDALMRDGVLRCSG